MEESEYYTIYPDEMRNEFLFHVFKRVVIGGSLCQYEDYIAEYMNATKAIYKGIIYIKIIDLVSAAKDPATNEIYIRSTAIQILDIEKANLYKVSNHPQNFLYLTIDPYQRHINVWYHKWVPYW
jgi:hypothetical protein